MESRAFPVEEARDVDCVLCFGVATKAAVEIGAAAKSSATVADESFTMVEETINDALQPNMNCIHS